MNRLLLSVLLLFPLTLSAQELHTFSNGEVADAEKINENFEYVLENATGSGGCSAEQDGSSVVITCADGTSGVLASEGTVIRYPSEGVVDSAEPVTYNTGDIVIKDGNGTTLGKVVAQLNEGTEFHSYYIELEVNGFVLQPLLYGQSTTETVRLIPEGGGGTWTTVYYLADDCSGAAWIQPRRNEVKNLFANLGDGVFYVPDTNATSEELLFKSGRRSEYMHYSSQVGWEEAAACSQGDFIANAYRATTYTPAPELTDAVYPLSLEQLP